MAMRRVAEPKMVDLSNFKLIPISKVDKAPWNYKKDDEEKAKTLTESIRKSGQIVNINVRQKKDGRWEVFDGNHRLDSFAVLGYKKVLAYDHGRISVQQAQRIAIELNEHRFDTNEKQLSEVMASIRDVFGEADMRLTMPPGFVLQETRFREDYEPDELPEPEFSGDDNRKGRIILVYEDDIEKALFMELLDIMEDRVVQDITDFPVLNEIAQQAREELAYAEGDESTYDDED